MSTVSDLIADKPVVIFSNSRNCCLSHSVKSLIESFGANPIVYEAEEIANGDQIQRELLQSGCDPSAPAVFIGQRYIGGASEIISLHTRNQLGPLLVQARAIWLWKKK